MTSLAINPIMSPLPHPAPAPPHRHNGNMNAAARRLANRRFPLLAALVLAAIGMAGTIWGPRYYGKTAWALPDDLWGTMIADQRLLHLDLGGLYPSPTALVSLPGTAVIMVPLVAVADLAGVSLAIPHGPYPAPWM